LCCHAAVMKKKKRFYVISVQWRKVEVIIFSYKIMEQIRYIIVHTQNRYRLKYY